MTDQEVNKIIAEFMGCSYSESVFNSLSEEDLDCLVLSNGGKYGLVRGRKIYTDNYFTESLDALVPAWEKLGLIDLKSKNFETINVVTEGFDSFYKAAAYTTAKAILELEHE